MKAECEFVPKSVDLEIASSYSYREWYDYESESYMIHGDFGSIVIPPPTMRPIRRSGPIQMKLTGYASVQDPYERIFGIEESELVLSFSDSVIADSFYKQFEAGKKIKMTFEIE